MLFVVAMILKALMCAFGSTLLLTIGYGCLARGKVAIRTLLEYISRWPNPIRGHWSCCPTLGVVAEV